MATRDDVRRVALAAVATLALAACDWGGGVRPDLDPVPAEVTVLTPDVLPAGYADSAHLEVRADRRLVFRSQIELACPAATGDAHWTRRRELIVAVDDQPSGCAGGTLETLWFRAVVGPLPSGDHVVQLLVGGAYLPAGSFTVVDQTTVHVP